tara:strand:+ start:68 stop:619 length:552 start_codon:yes stop_codon:yes gene_type:complete
MNYDYITGIIGDYPLPVILTFYFLFLTLFGDIRIKISSSIVFLSSLFIIVSADYDFSLVGNIVSDDLYIQDIGISILWDGVTALIIIMFVRYDDYAIDQSILLIFATAWHIMVLSSLLSDRTGLFFIWYDELIIAVGLLQMMVSYDGFIHALSNLQSLLLRACNYCNRTVENLSACKKIRKRS